MLLRTALFALPLLLVASAAQAQDDPAPADCENAVTQAQIDACASGDYDKADAELNKVYGQAVARLQKADKDFAATDSNDVGAVEALKKAQRAWINYRDASCELAGFEARGGTLENTIYIGCQTDLTRKRTAELRELLKAEWLN